MFKRSFSSPGCAIKTFISSSEYPFALSREYCSLVSSLYGLFKKGTL
jgi:hypothetical protein